MPHHKKIPMYVELFGGPLDGTVQVEEERYLTQPLRFSVANGFMEECRYLVEYQATFHDADGGEPCRHTASGAIRFGFNGELAPAAAPVSLVRETGKGATFSLLPMTEEESEES